MGGPALRPEAVSRTSVVGVNRILVVRGWTEMSVRLPVIVAADADWRQRAMVSRLMRMAHFRFSIFEISIGDMSGILRVHIVVVVW